MPLRYMFLGILLFAIGVAAPAHANSLFVASNGNDAGACTRTAPCVSIGAAINLAFPNDTIICLDPVSNGGFSITKSIDIDCSGARATIRDGSSIVITLPVAAPDDPLRTVRLRGISINGAAGNAKVVTRGIEITSATMVSIEDCVISDVVQQGIFDHRTGGQTKLFITDSIIRNNGGVGIAIGSQGPSTTVLDNVRSENNNYGFAVVAGNSVVINRSVMSGNTVAGVEADGGSQVVVNNSTISHNGSGVQSAQSVRLSNNDIAFNTTAVSGSSGTFGNNRFSGNGTMGTSPAALGGASSDLGQQ